MILSSRKGKHGSTDEKFMNEMCIFYTRIHTVNATDCIEWRTIADILAYKYNMTKQFQSIGTHRDYKLSINNGQTVLIAEMKFTSNKAFNLNGRCCYYCYGEKIFHGFDSLIDQNRICENGRHRIILQSK